MQEALEALHDSSRPLVARLAEAIELERECQEALKRAAETRAGLEAEREAQLAERQGARGSAAERYRQEGLTGADVRDAILKFQGGFTISELASILDCEAKEIKKFLEPMLLSGVVADTGQKFNRKTIFEYVQLQAMPTPAREYRTPPEIATAPAGELRQATGMPVRVSASQKLTRKGRSTSGQGHFHRQRDKRYEQMMEARGKGKESVKEANARAKMEVDMDALRKKAAKNRGKKK
jgi:hypothetical protein